MQLSSLMKVETSELVILRPFLCSQKHMYVYVSSCNCMSWCQRRNRKVGSLVAGECNSTVVINYNCK
jgi:hypothetical protein